jgi:hypothetical protein
MSPPRTATWRPPPATRLAWRRASRAHAPPQPRRRWSQAQAQTGHPASRQQRQVQRPPAIAHQRRQRRWVQRRAWQARAASRRAAALAGRAERPRWTCRRSTYRPAQGDAAVQRRDTIAQPHRASERRTHQVDGPLSVLAAHVSPRARLQKHASGVQMTVYRCPMQRCVTIIVDAMHIRARSHQRVDGGCVAPHCGPHERCYATAVRAIHACACLQQRNDRSNVAVICSCSKWTTRARSCICVGIRARSDKCLDGGCVTTGSSIQKRRVGINIRAIHACTCLQQRSDRSDVALVRSSLQRRPVACSLERIGIRARRDLPLHISDIAAPRSVAQFLVRAGHCLPAHTRPTPRHAGSLSLVAPPHAHHRERRVGACGTVRRVVGERAARSVASSHPRARRHTGGGAATKRAPARQARRVADWRWRRGQGGGPATRAAGALGPHAIGAARSGHRPLPAPRSPRVTRRPAVVPTCCVRTSGWARQRCAGSAGVPRGNGARRWAGGELQVRGAW